LIYVERLKKPRILEFSSRNSKTAKFARFYIPSKSGDADVLELVSSWFRQLAVAKAFTVVLEQIEPWGKPPEGNEKEART
jgi:hypothetical protein